ncbi:hypothetical protein [Salipiger abyssi]|uniref:hypothetical protein n=1 Tax=Salipiger abyssi TaxID=1250539 RepID=UPI0040587F73
MTRLLPRLTPVGVEICMLDMRENGVDEVIKLDLDARLSRMSQHIWYAPTGGSPDKDLLKRITHEVRTTADECDFATPGNDVRKAQFDTTLAKRLASLPRLDSGEALRDDVWSCLGCVVLPEYAAWRYSPGQTERFRGGVRNTFQRLWMRGSTLDLGPDHPGRWRLADGLSEDAMVQIFERAAVASDPRLVRAMANEWLATASRVGRNRMEPIMRRATKMIRLREQIYALSERDEASLVRELHDIFSDAARSLSVMENQSRPEVEPDPAPPPGRQRRQSIISRITSPILKAR